MFILLRPIAWVGQVVVSGISSIGEVVCILLNTLKFLPRVYKNPNLLLHGNGCNW